MKDTIINGGKKRTHNSEIVFMDSLYTSMFPILFQHIVLVIQLTLDETISVLIRKGK